MVRLSTADLDNSLSLPHALQNCWDIQLACVDADVLRLALEIGIFSALDDYASPGAVAESFGLNEVSTGYFLELLWCMGVLERRETSGIQYRTEPSVRPYLHPRSALYCGDALMFRHKVLRQPGGQLEVLLRKQVPDANDAPADEPLQRAWAKAARMQLAQEQRAVTTDVACELLRSLPEFERLRSMLDLGGGPGLVAVALAELLPELRGVVFEYPLVAEVAQENIERAGLSHRLLALGGDLAKDDWGRNYDLIWCSSVLHFVPAVAPVLARLYEALAPDGVLVCCHAEIGSDPVRTRRIRQYYLRLRMQNRHVWPAGQLATQLQQAGFASVEQIDDVRFPMTTVTVLIARKGKE